MFMTRMGMSPKWQPHPRATQGCHPTGWHSEGHYLLLALRQRR